MTDNKVCGLTMRVGTCGGALKFRGIYRRDHYADPTRPAEYFEAYSCASCERWSYIPITEPTAAQKAAAVDGFGALED